MSKYQIPALSDKQLATRYARIHPVVRDDDDRLRYIVPPAPRTQAFTWDPKVQEKAEGLTVLRTIPTLHTYGYYGFFKPTVAEVLAQIPEEDLERVVAFETNGPKDVNDLHAQWDVVNAGFHQAQTVLYTGVPRHSRDGRIALDKISEILG